MTDERLNLPSASSFSIDDACNGRQNLIRSIPPESLVKEAVDDESAQRGQRLHAAWSTGNTLELEPDEQEDFQAGVKYRDLVIQQWMRDNNLDAVITDVREQRLWLHDPETMSPIMSGQIDEYSICGDDKHGLIIDQKSGFNPNLAPSQRNFQLRCYAVLLWKEHPTLEKIRVALIKPKSRVEPTDYTDYSVADLEYSERQILFTLWKTRQVDARRVPGSHCRWCEAKSQCAEAASFALLPSAKNLDVAVMVAQMTPQDLAVVVERATIITQIIDAAKTRFKSLPEETLAALGWKLKEGRKLDPIVDTKGAFEKLKAEGFSEDDLFSALSFGKGDLGEMIRKYKPMSKQKASEWIDTELDAAIERKRAEKSVERI